VCLTSTRHRSVVHNTRKLQLLRPNLVSVWVSRAFGSSVENLHIGRGCNVENLQIEFWHAIEKTPHCWMRQGCNSSVDVAICI
jgi:hypothetical protein